jgi:site-specific DNA-methyltransferase (adenine-specific)
MTEQTSFTLRNRNPDVLTCIANLSNDEVFTPPDLANQMLDTLTETWAKDHKGENIWENMNVKFLDPCTKSGVFLREITSRLTKGLEKKIPDLERRVDHILSKQIYGIGITRLTSLLARRSVYCSKNADGEHSIAKCLDSKDGNIWFEKTQHTWIRNNCKFCGASKNTLDRDVNYETHAYAFIHTHNLSKELKRFYGKDMQFDVIIGNPPYQMKDGGHQASATPIYQKFIESAISLDPEYIVMVTPSRWFQGGRGLSDFREKMLSDKRLSTIVDFIRDKDAFPTINVNGGVNYFLWSKNYKGKCSITTIEQGGVAGKTILRDLNEFDIFVRRNEAVEILRKIKLKKEENFSDLVSSLKPFGLRTNFFGSDNSTKLKNIKLYSSGKITWVSRDEIISNEEWIDCWKVLIPRATDGNENYPLPIWDAKGPFISGPNEACTETYLIASLATDEQQASYIRDYMRTKFFRFLVSLKKITQDNKADNFSFVPAIPMNKKWNDELLYKRYEINDNEISFIDSMIRTIEWKND